LDSFWQKHDGFVASTKESMVGWAASQVLSFYSVRDAFYGSVGNLVGTIIVNTQSAIDGVQNAIGVARSWAVGYVANLIMNAFSAIASIQNGIGVARRWAVGWVANLIVNAAGAIASIGSGIGTARRWAIRWLATLAVNVGGALSAIGGAISRAQNWARTYVATFVSRIIGGAPGRAHGGVIGAASGGARGNMVMVGEAGRELVRLPYGSTVIPNGQTEAMVKRGGGGGGGMVLEIRSGGSRLDELLVELLRKAIRTQGGDVQVVLGGS